MYKYIDLRYRIIWYLLNPGAQGIHILMIIEFRSPIQDNGTILNSIVGNVSSTPKQWMVFTF